MATATAARPRRSIQLVLEKYLTTCAQRVKFLRLAEGWTQQTFALNIGLVSGSSIGGYERGVGLPSTRTLIKMATMAGFSPDFLLGFRDENQRYLPQHRKIKKA